MYSYLALPQHYECQMFVAFVCIDCRETFMTKDIRTCTQNSRRLPLAVDAGDGGGALHIHVGDVTAAVVRHVTVVGPRVRHGGPLPHCRPQPATCNHSNRQSRHMQTLLVQPASASFPQSPSNSDIHHSFMQPFYFYLKHLVEKLPHARHNLFYDLCELS